MDTGFHVNEPNIEGLNCWHLDQLKLSHQAPESPLYPLHGMAQVTVLPTYINGPKILSRYVRLPQNILMHVAIAKLALYLPHCFFLEVFHNYAVVITPRAHARARGYVIGRGVYYILYIIYYIYICKTFFYLSKYSLSEVYFNTDRLLIEFNGLWYSLAARQVFVAIANPDSLSLGKGSTTPETQTLHRLQTTPLR